MSVPSWLGIGFLLFGLLSYVLWTELFDQLTKLDVKKSRPSVLFPWLLIRHRQFFTGKYKILFWCWVGTVAVVVSLFGIMVVAVAAR